MPFPVELRFIKQAEAKLGVILPRGYVGRMVESNGGEVEAARDFWQLHPILDTSDRTRLKRTCNDVCRETAVMRGWPDFPAAGVAIAGNGSGDQLVFLPDPGQAGQLQDAVYFWDHETGALSKVATDFMTLRRTSAKAAARGLRE